MGCQAFFLTRQMLCDTVQLLYDQTCTTGVDPGILEGEYPPPDANAEGADKIKRFFFALKVRKM